MRRTFVAPVSASARREESAPGDEKGMEGGPLACASLAKTKPTKGGRGHCGAPAAHASESARAAQCRIRRMLFVCSAPPGPRPPHTQRAPSARGASVLVLLASVSGASVFSGLPSLPLPHMNGVSRGVPPATMEDVWRLTMPSGST